MTERVMMENLGRCYQQHRALAQEARRLHLEVANRNSDADLLRLGANCMMLSARHAIESHDDYSTLRSWRECALAEKQIRMATYRALRAGHIGKRRYDELFALATQASRVREDERQRLRRRLLRTNVV